MVKQLIAGRYQITELLRQGNMGTIYLATDEKLQANVNLVIKQIKKRKNAVNAKNELYVLKELKHDGLPRILDFDEDEDYVYIVEDYIKGENLGERLRRGQNISEKDVVVWTQKICGILNYLHTKKPHPIIHRDIKPDNIMIDCNGNIVLVDFGISIPLTDENGAPRYGTLGYMAPEQARGDTPDIRSDIYSLGMTLYHLLTGVPPAKNGEAPAPVRQINAYISKRMEKIVYKCIQVDPARRYQSVAEIQKVLPRNYYTGQIRFILCSIIMLLLVASGVGVHTLYKNSVNKEYNQLIRQGNALVDSFQPYQAEDFFSKAQALDNKRLEAFCGHAWVLYLVGEYSEAERYIQMVQGLFPERSIKRNAETYGDLLYLLANCYYEQANYEQAAREYENAITFREEKQEYYRDLAVCLARLNNTEQAMEKLKMALNLGADEASAKIVEAEIALAKGKIKQSETLFTQAMSLAQSPVLKQRIFLSLSNLYTKNAEVLEGALKKKISFLEQAAQDEHLRNNYGILETLAAAYLENAENLQDRTRDEEFLKAADCYRRIIEQGHSNYRVEENLATLYLKIGDYGRCQEQLKRMETKYPENYRIFLRWAQLVIYSEMDKPADNRDFSLADSYYKKAVQLYEMTHKKQGDDSEMEWLKETMDDLQKNGWLNSGSI